jgi:plastocyanin
MIFLWLISFSLFCAQAATVTGHVELADSRDPAVHKRKDYSGVVVALRPLRADAAPLAPAKATIVQKDKSFSPHILAVSTGTVVDFPNFDPIYHNAFSSYNGQIFDVGLYPPGSSRAVKFGREGVVRVFCNIHSAMSAIIVVLRTPYFATSERDGSFSIPNLPPGDYELTVFHERASEAKLAELTRKVSVSADPLVLPPISISEAGFLAIPHKNKFGHEYGAEPSDSLAYPGQKK